jgi:hypothetical protein
LSLGAVVVEAGVVVVVVEVVVAPVPVPVDDDPDPLVVVVVVVAPELGVVVVVAVAVAGGATKATVSPCIVAALVEGAADRPVQLRAAVQLWSAVAAGVPLRGWGSPARIVAGRNTTPVMWRPSAVMMREPLSVSGAVSS